MSDGALRMERLANASLGPFTVGEATPTVLIAAAALWDTVLGHAEVISGPPWAVALLLCAAAVALLWRRRHPLLVLAAVAFLELVQVLALGPTQSISGPLALAVAVFACGAHGVRPWAYLGIALGMVMVLIGTWAEDPDAFGDSWAWSLNVLWIFGLGALVRWQMVLTARARDAVRARAMAAAAEERLAVARDLHDVLAHSLAVMIVQAEAADELIDSDPERAHGALARVESTGRSALADIRGLVETLRSDEPTASAPSARGADLDGLEPLLESFRASGLPVELRLAGDVSGVPEDTGRVVFRVVQEALTNALRHAGAVSTVVTIDVDRAAGVRVGVRNDGASSPVAVGAVATAGGHGLKGMRERVEDAGGVFEAGATSDGGFEVTAWLPLDGAGR